MPTLEFEAQVRLGLVRQTQEFLPNPEVSVGDLDGDGDSGFITPTTAPDDTRRVTVVLSRP